MIHATTRRRTGYRIDPAAPRTRDQPPERFGALQDSLVLTLIMLASFAPYVHRLGIYTDNWAFLASLSLSPDQSPLGLFKAIFDPQGWMRPAERAYWVILYLLFGTEPLGHNVANTAALTCIVLLFYHVLRELDQPRLVALAVPAVYGLLPHYSTTRFWSPPSNPHVALYFLSLYAELRVLRPCGRYPLAWKALSVLSMILSGLFKEEAIPLFLLHPVIAWYRGQQLYRESASPKPARARWPVLLLGNLLVLAPLVAFKMLTTTRLDGRPFFERTIQLARDAVRFDYGENVSGLNIWRAIELSYGEYGIALPRVVWNILQEYPEPALTLAGVATALALLLYLMRVADRSDARFLRPSFTFLLGVIGLGVFAGGYAIFLTNPNVGFTATGIDNRAAIAATIGVALSFVGSAGFLSSFLASWRWRTAAFCTAVAMICWSGFMINNTIARFWILAYERESEILAEISHRFPTLPAGSTVVLDGVCPYIGPAIVFESFWDLRGALQLFYRDPTLGADVVTRRLQVQDRGLTTNLYGTRKEYPYGNLLVYHFGTKSGYWLSDRAAANHYFRTITPDRSNGCPEGHEGSGVRIFWQPPWRTSVDAAEGVGSLPPAPPRVLERRDNGQSAPSVARSTPASSASP